jgi:Repeat of unknown function (DUF5648)
MKKYSRILIAFSLLANIAVMGMSAPASATDYSNNDMMDDGVFNNFNSMGSTVTSLVNPPASDYAQVTNFLNGSDHRLAGASTCLITDNYTFPNWYYDGTNFHYGDDATWNTAWGPAQVSAAQIIYTSAHMWDINPEVILSTLQKEEGLVYGPGAYGCTSSTNTDFQSAMGYGCPDSGGCDPHYAGLTRQVLWGSWQLMFDEQRAEGNLGWLGNNSLVYGGFWSNGTYQDLPYQRCDTCAQLPSAYTSPSTIDGQSITIQNGATAALFTYTPHLNQSFPGIFEGWFGPTTAGLEAVYRLFDASNQDHLLTTSTAEESFVENAIGFHFENIAFFVNPTQAAGQLPIYRIYNPGIQDHMLVINPAEVNVATSQLGYHNDGVQFYASQTMQPGLVPVYRLYNPGTGHHLFTDNSVEYSVLVQRGGYRDEGVPFYASPTQN